MKPEERENQIRQMEAYFDRLTEAVRRDPESVSRDPKLQADLARLEAYYNSGLWMADYTADEQGLVSPNLKRGVLSEDGIYDLLEEIHQAGSRFHPAECMDA